MKRCIEMYNIKIHYLLMNFFKIICRSLYTIYILYLSLCFFFCHSVYKHGLLYNGKYRHSVYIQLIW